MTTTLTAINGLSIQSASGTSTKPIFTWFPDEGASENIKPAVAATKYGDGYEQRVVLGINSQVTGWTVKFTGAISAIYPIRAFLITQNAVTPFQWVNPFGELGMYVCRSWTSVKTATAMIEISAVFDRVYEANI